MSSRPNPGESRGKSRDGTGPLHPPGQPAGLSREQGGDQRAFLTLAPDSGGRRFRDGHGVGGTVPDRRLAASGMTSAALGNRVFSPPTIPPPFQLRTAASPPPLKNGGLSPSPAWGARRPLVIPDAARRRSPFVIPDAAKRRSGTLPPTPWPSRKRRPPLSGARVRKARGSPPGSRLSPAACPGGRRGGPSRPGSSPGFRRGSAGMTRGLCLPWG